MTMNMTTMTADGKIVIVGGGPVGSLAALYASHYHDNVEVYELRGGPYFPTSSHTHTSS